jgi:predicted permease
VPDWKQYVRDRLPLQAMKRQLEDEIIEEVATQLEDCCIEAMARGVPEDEAVALAREQITDWGTLAEDISSARRGQVVSSTERRVEAAEQTLRRKGRRWTAFADLSQDLRFGSRTLRKRPLFALVAILTLGLGIGAMTAIFSVVDGVLLQDLPYEDPGSLVSIWEAFPSWREMEERDAMWDRVQFTFRDYLDLRRGATLIKDVAVYAGWGEMALTGAGAPEQLSVGIGSANLLRVLGVEPVLGRGFLPGEDAEQAGQAAQVVVLSHELWQRRFGGDREILGKTLSLNGKPFTAVGILPSGFRLHSFMVTYFTQGSTDQGLRDLWVPIGQEGIDLAGEGNAFEVLGRLAPGVTLAQARAEAQTLLPEETGPPDREVRLEPRKEVVTQGVGTPLLLILCAAAVLLLVACANVATLLIGEATARRQELATRSALGAGRFRVARQLLTESVILGVLGSGVGILIAVLGTRALVSLAPPLPRLEEVEVSGRVLLFAVGAGLSTGLVFGLAPLVLAARDSVGAALVSRGQSGTLGSRRFQSFVVALQIALTFVLLVAGGLFARSLMRLNEVDPGFNPANLATFTVSATGTQYSTQAEATRFFDDVVRELASVSGVLSVAGSHGLPFPGGAPRNLVTIGDREEAVPVRRRTVLPSYHETLGIPLLAGRVFTEMDAADKPKVMVVSESMAHRYWPEDSPIGSTVSLWNRTWTIVGIVGDVRHTTLREGGEPTVYIPLAQAPRRDLSFAVRTRTDAADSFPLIREAVWSVDPDMPVTEMTTMSSMIAESAGDDRYRTFLTLTFAVVAVILAAVGVFGVTARSVTQRTREIGIRMALGARDKRLVGMFLRRALVVGLAGIAAGVVASAWVSGLLSHFLFGVEARDRLTYGAVASVLLLICLAAGYIPAKRAARVAPMDVLREE